jgi:hypothetical protein
MIRRLHPAFLSASEASGERMRAAVFFFSKVFFFTSTGSKKEKLGSARI